MMMRRCAEEDYDNVKEMFNRIYPYNTLLQKKDYFDWQFRSNPLNNNDEYTLWLLTRDSRIVGFYGWTPVAINLNGKRIMGCEPTLWWADKAYSGGGLMLLNKIMGDFEYRIYHGCSSEAEKIFSLYNMPMFSTPRFVGILDTDKVRKLFDIGEIRDINSINGFPLDSIDEIVVLKRFDDGEEMKFDNFKTIKNHIRYTGSYLNWRYFEIPRHNYHAIKLAKTAEYCIYRIEEIMDKNCKILRIMDWNFNLETGKNALNYLIKEAKTNNAILIDFFCSASEIGSNFLSYGFRNSKSELHDLIPHYFRPIYFGRDYVTCIDVPPYRVKDAVRPYEWYITKGNGDIDRQKR